MAAADPANNENVSESFDYVIVGAGAAGSVLAYRLSENGRYSVCVLEAGGVDRYPFIHIPAGFIKTLTHKNLMWQFASEPAVGSGGRSVKLPQGKVVGGSTSINGLVYNRGQAADYDGWAALGNPGWSYQEVLPYFRRSESREADESQYRGSMGPMHISDPAFRDPLCDAFIDTVASHGVSKHQDYNGPSQSGAGYYQRFIKGRRRVSAASAFLKPAMRRPNVTVRTGVMATKILFEQKRATGVLCSAVDGSARCYGEGMTIMAKRELIVSAGTVNTTRLLQLSGVGCGAFLQSMGVTVAHDLPGVGENFQDHYFVRCAARTRPGAMSLNQRARGLSLLAQIARWVNGRPNILTLSPSIAYAFVNSDTASGGLDGQPDLQFVFTPGSYKPGRVYELDDFPAVTCGFTQQRPESTGSIKIRSNDIHDAPIIQPNYLAAEVDRQAAIRGIKLSRQFLTSGALGQHYLAEQVPGGELQTDDELLDYARNTGNTGYHLVGTCCMGPASNPQAVVSADLRVHGLQGIRVIDASVMPRVTSSNTCAASLMIGEKGADFVIAAQRSE